MVRIGWLADTFPGITGGAEISDNAFLAGAPEGVEVVRWPAGKRPPDGFDGFILNNCITYGDEWLGVFEQKPVVKHVHDLWPYGSPNVRRWVLDNAALVIFNSPKHREIFQFPVGAPYTFVPPPVDVRRFRTAAAAAAASGFPREGTIWLGRVATGKGLQHCVDWAMREGESLDVWGPCYDPMSKAQIVPPAVYRGKAEYDKLPGLLPLYERFIHLPLKPDVCGRVAVEAWAAGCELLLGGDVEAFWEWVTVADFQNAVGIFWDKTLRALGYARD